MFNRVPFTCRPSCEGEVVEIVERRGVRRAKVVSAGALIEVATFAGADIHLGDRIAFDVRLVSQRPHPVLTAIELDDLLDGTDDTDAFLFRW